MNMDNPPKNLKDGVRCKVVAGAHAGKSGIVKDIKAGKTGFISITVVQADGERFKTLAKNVEIKRIAGLKGGRKGEMGEKVVQIAKVAGAVKAVDFESIDDYIRSLPRPVQSMMRKLRAAVRKAAPDAVEIIRYRMPTFFLEGNLIHFAAFKHHIGMYPMPRGTAALRKAMEPYQAAKGTLRFPMDKPLPFPLIAQVIAHRIKETTVKPVKS